MLFLFGTGPIKGFAVTLSLGIVTSMFTAIMGTRAVVNLVYGGQQTRRRNWRFDSGDAAMRFFDTAKPISTSCPSAALALVFSVILLILSIISSLVLSRKLNFGLDFTGGMLIEVAYPAGACRSPMCAAASKAAGTG